MFLNILISTLYSLLLIFSFWGIGAFAFRVCSFRFYNIVQKNLFSVGFGYFLITNFLFILGLLELINFQSAFFVYLFSVLLSSYTFYKLIIVDRPKNINIIQI